MDGWHSARHRVECSQIADGFPLNAMMSGSGAKELTEFLLANAVKRIQSTDAETILFALSLFATHAEQDILKKVASLPDDRFKKGLVRLKRLSLVIEEADTYRLLPLTQAFVRGSMDEEFETLLREKQVASFLGFGKARTLYTPFRAESFERIRANRLNIYDLMNWCSEKKHQDMFIDLLTTIQDTLAIYGFWSEREQWALRAVKAADEIKDKGGPRVPVRRYSRVGCGDEREHKQAEQWLQIGLKFAQESEKQDVECMALRYLARLPDQPRHSSSSAGSRSEDQQSRSNSRLGNGPRIHREVTRRL